MVRFLLAAMTLVAVVIYTEYSSAAETIPLKDFFKNPTTREFKISPDGQWLAFLKPWESRMNLFVRPTKGGEEKRLTSVKDRDIASFFWKGSKDLLFLKDFGGDENFHIFRVGIAGGEEKDLTPLEKTRVEVVDELAYVSDTDLLISHNHRNPEVFDVYRLSIKDNSLKLVVENPGNYIEYLADHDGKVRIATRTVGTDTEVLYREKENQAFAPILKYDYTHEAYPVLFTPDNKNIYFASNLGRDKESLVEFDPRTKKEVRIIYQNPEYDLFDGHQELIYSEKQKRLLGFSYVTWKQNLVFFDTAFESALSSALEKLGLANVTILSHDKSEQKFTILASSDKSRGKVYLFDIHSKELSELSDLAPWLKQDSLATMQPVQYKSRDGFVINGYLTLPKGAVSKNLPIVINPHGGPWGRDIWRFNPEIQFLASRGFGVLQMNFRGSTGYGRKFLIAADKQWGLTMQDDVTDGAQWLIDNGIADRKRIAIYGGSYGGYQTDQRQNDRRVTEAITKPHPNLLGWVLPSENPALFEQ